MAAQARRRKPGLHRRLLKRARIPLILRLSREIASRTAATAMGRKIGVAGRAGIGRNVTKAARKSGADYT